MNLCSTSVGRSGNGLMRAVAEAGWRRLWPAVCKESVPTHRMAVRRDVRRYVVTLTGGTTRSITADRYRYDNDMIIFEIRRYDDSLPSARRWQEVWVLPRGELVALDPPDPDPLLGS